MRPARSGAAQLGFAEVSAYKRMRRARAAAKCPQILEYLADGELTLGSVKLIAPHLEEPEGPELIEEARGTPCARREAVVGECSLWPWSIVFPPRPARPTIAGTSRSGNSPLQPAYL